MSRKGDVKPNPAAWVTLACGHVLLYLPPVPERHAEITCGVCGEPTEVAA